jgi:hypothetical protein
MLNMICGEPHLWLYVRQAASSLYLAAKKISTNFIKIWLMVYNKLMKKFEE